jgi:putative redox protein
MKDIAVTFPGGKRVDAHYDGRTVGTDQSISSGGAAAGPEPFDLFFVSIATCVGIYVLEFCRSRHLDTAGLGVRLQAERGPDGKRYSHVGIRITLPADFPDRYRRPILSTADLCAVKKHILDPPEFEISLSETVGEKDAA